MLNFYKPVEALPKREHCRLNRTSFVSLRKLCLPTAVFWYSVHVFWCLIKVPVVALLVSIGRTGGSRQCMIVFPQPTAYTSDAAQHQQSYTSKNCGKVATRDPLLALLSWNHKAPEDCSFNCIQRHSFNHLISPARIGWRQCLCRAGASLLDMCLNRGGGHV